MAAGGSAETDRDQGASRGRLITFAQIHTVQSDFSRSTERCQLRLPK